MSAEALAVPDVDQRHHWAPKGCEHSTAAPGPTWRGRRAPSRTSSPTTRYWCMADIGRIRPQLHRQWPLALGTTTVIDEGVPNYPTVAAWRRRLGVKATSPTPRRRLTRMLRGRPGEPKKYDYDFKQITTVGEPIEPRSGAATIRGRQGRSGHRRHWWRPRGGFLGSTLPRGGSDEARQPRAWVGVYPVISTRTHQVGAGSGKAGNICIRTRGRASSRVSGLSPTFVATDYASSNQAPGQEGLAARLAEDFAGDGRSPGRPTGLLRGSSAAWTT